MSGRRRRSTKNTDGISELGGLASSAGPLCSSGSGVEVTSSEPVSSSINASLWSRLVSKHRSPPPPPSPPVSRVHRRTFIVVVINQLLTYLLTCWQIAFSGDSSAACMHQGLCTTDSATLHCESERLRLRDTHWARKNRLETLLLISLRAAGLTTAAAYSVCQLNSM